MPSKETIACLPEEVSRAETFKLLLSNLQLCFELGQLKNVSLP